ncbi:MAG TPA: hypothetical protein DEO95_08790 [Ruminococcaceae bacterium]|nr:hypothetical protein [Oscillospiraceae bacterium]
MIIIIRNYIPSAVYNVGYFSARHYCIIHSFSTKRVYCLMIPEKKLKINSFRISPLFFQIRHKMENCTIIQIFKNFFTVSY